MLHSHSTTKSLKPNLEAEQLQGLVTDLTEAKEGAIVGGQSTPGFTLSSGVVRETPLSPMTLIELIYI